MSETNPKNWQINEDKTLSAIGEVTPSVAPGVYEAGEDYWDRPMLRPVDLGQERVFEFDDSIVNAVMEGARRFQSQAAVYKQLGLTHRYGVLLYGEPGTGKSAIGKLLLQRAAQLGGYGLMASHYGQLAKCLKALDATNPNVPVMVLMEDFENLLDHQEHGWLQLLSGVEQVREGVIYVATTNHLAKLPPRIRQRPGRFNKVLEVKSPSSTVRRSYIEQLTQNVPDAPTPDLAERTEGMTFDQVRATVILSLTEDVAPAEAARTIRELGKLDDEDGDNDEK